MAVIGNVRTVVSTNIQPLTAGLNMASSAIGRFGKLAGRNAAAGLTMFSRSATSAGKATLFFGRSIKSVMMTLGPVTAGLAAVGAAYKTVTGVFSAMEGIDNLAKMADATGMTTESLAGLRRAGERAGVSSERVDTGIARMQRTISNAASGVGAATKHFGMLGLSVDNIRKLSPEDQFFAIADSIAQMPDAADRTRVAMQVFGREGASILKMVEKGSEAARQELAKAAELGLAPSREDAALVEQANDAMADMMDSFRGLANVIAINVSPAITSMSDMITKTVVMARKGFESIRPIATQMSHTITAAFQAVYQVGSMVFSGLSSASGTTFGQMMDAVLDFAIMAEFGYMRFKDIAALALDFAQLKLIGYWEEFKYTFTERLPKTLTWFAGNWRDIMFTAVDYALTILINLGENIRKVWSGVLDFISGRGFNVDFTPLTEGFVSHVKSMPDIAERELTATEKVLQDSVARMGGQLTDDLAEHMQMRRQGLPGMEIPELQLTHEIADTIADRVEELTGAGAVERGSAEAFSQIFAAMRGDSVQDKMLKANEKMLTEQEKQTRELRDLAQRQPIELVAASI